jgi:hypothetical protein
MLCKSLGFHGGDYDECRLLGYTLLILYKAQLISQEHVCYSVLLHLS